MSAARRLLLALAALAPAAPAAAQTVYVVGSGRQLGSFDLATRQYTQVSPALAPVGVGFRTLTSNGAGGFYTFQNDGSSSTLTSVTTGGAVTAVGPPQVGLFAQGAALSAAGTLHLLNGNSEFGTVNRSTGGFTLVNQSSLAAAGSNRGALAYAAGALYAYIDRPNLPAPSAALFAVNPSTGAATQIGGDNTAAAVRRLTLFGVGSDLYGLSVSGNTLYSISPTDGALTSRGSLTGVGLPAGFVGAYAVAPVPEPATAGLLAAAGLGLVGVARRRRGR